MTSNLGLTHVMRRLSLFGYTLKGSSVTTALGHRRVPEGVDYVVASPAARTRTTRSPARTRASLGGTRPPHPPQPLGATMYCLPSTLYVDGLEWWPLPHWNDHRWSPLSASSAL